MSCGAAAVRATAVRQRLVVPADDLEIVLTK
jgi:hypothetical protein